MKNKSVRMLCAFSILPLLSTGGLAQVGESPVLGKEFVDDDEGYLTVYFDNDIFGGEDQDYTNGFRLSWISDDRNVEDLGPVQRVLRRFSGDPDSFAPFRSITGFEDPKKIRYNYGFSLTQLMFTPEDSYPSSQPEGQRRYAGWLGLGLSLHVKDDAVLNSIEFIIGTTGQNSLAENTQDFIHELKGSDKFNGWDDQIPNEITADLSFVQKRRADFLNMGIGNLRMDGLTEWGAHLGTFRTEAHLGGLVRVGFNLPPDFSDPRITSTAYSHRYFGTDGAYVGNWSVYTLFGAKLHGVAYDATLDGPVFHDFETGNKRTPLVAESFFGFGVRYRSVEVSYVHTWRTEEYREQDGISDFGSVAVRMRF
jgi:lipid A 3-O-deacylase